ncbi:unnamed protein product, partial [Musa banksii]
ASEVPCLPPRIACLVPVLPLQRSASIEQLKALFTQLFDKIPQLKQLVLGWGCAAEKCVRCTY